MKESCKTCISIRRLYVPPIDAYKDIPKDKYACMLFEDEGQGMYLDGDGGMCEMYTRREE